jgi:predicted DNA-binding protein YlxM (UPF0122 family)
MEVENIFEITVMIDFYGHLLTKRQYEIMNMHYNLDYSLAEISENLNITRQGVHDTIRKSKALLKDLENKLGLVNRYNIQNKKKQKALKILNNLLKIYKDTDVTDDLKKLKEIINTIQ